jgi:hypothetical protein
MAETLRLTATLEPRGPAGAFVLTDDQVAEISGGKKAFPVRVRVNGHDLPLRLARMGGENMIGLAKAARQQAGVEIGTAYDVEIALDDTPRTVDVPADLATALAADPAADKAFAAMPFTHRKEYVRWVTEAKRDTTRADRIAKAIEMVRTGKTR